MIYSFLFSKSRYQINSLSTVNNSVQIFLIRVPFLCNFTAWENSYLENFIKNKSSNTSNSSRYCDNSYLPIFKMSNSHLEFFIFVFQVSNTIICNRDFFQQVLLESPGLFLFFTWFEPYILFLFWVQISPLLFAPFFTDYFLKIFILSSIFYF